MLTEQEIKRYQRQIEVFGEECQEKLKNASVLVAGTGGLGSSIAIYLACAGIGKMRLVDRDIVDLTNLNRQILYADSDVGRKKAECARDKIRMVNPSVEVEALSTVITEDSVNEIVDGCDMVLDAMDNFHARYLLNKAILAKNIPLFHGAIDGFYGQATTIVPGRTACLRCVYSQAPPATSWPAVGVTCGILGCIQATEAIKYIVGKGRLLENRLLLVDGLDMVMEEIPVEKNPRCEDCC